MEGLIQIGVDGGVDDFGHTSLPRHLPVKDGWGIIASIVLLAVTRLREHKEA